MFNVSSLSGWLFDNAILAYSSFRFCLSQSNIRVQFKHDPVNEAFTNMKVCILKLERCLSLNQMLHEDTLEERALKSVDKHAHI